MNKKFLITIIFLATIIIFLLWRFPYAIKTFDDKMKIVQVTIMLCVLLPGIARYTSAKIIKSLGIWLGFIVILMLVYINKNNLKSAFLPNQIIKNDDGTLMLNANDRGHFFAEVLINDQPFNCLIDTGASQVILSLSDAKSLGIKKQDLSFDITTNTANGFGSAARYQLNSFSLGPITLNNFPILINKEEGECLIGMSFLRKLNSFTIDGDKLIMLP